MDSTAEILFEYLRESIYNPETASLDLNSLPDDFQELGMGLLYYVKCVNEVRSFAAELAKGNLSAPTPPRGNELAAGLKSLQASLRHLSWQTQMVASGDYSQKVDFMGEFSEAFNKMITQLEHRQNTLIADVSQERLKVAELRDVAYVDTLTGLFNRHYGMQVLGSWLDESRQFTLSFLDIDNLKYVNDTFGHAEGDVYIRYVVEHIRHFEDDGGVVCRLGGDEFMILCENISKEQTYARLLDVQSQLANSGSDSTVTYWRSISFGVAESDEPGAAGVSELLGIADDRMYENKRKQKELRRISQEE